MANVSMYQTSGGFESGLRSGAALGQSLRQSQSRNALQEASGLIQQGQDPNAVIQQLMSTDPAAAQQLLNMRSQQQQFDAGQQELEGMKQRHGMRKLQMAGMPLFGAMMQNDIKVQDKLIDEAAAHFKGASDGTYDSIVEIKKLPFEQRVDALGQIVSTMRKGGIFPDDPNQIGAGQSADIAKFEYWKRLNPNASPEQAQEMYNKIIDPYSRAFATGVGGGQARLMTEQGLNPILAEREAGKITATEDTETGRAKLAQERQAVAKAEREAADAAKSKENAVVAINNQLQQLGVLRGHKGFGRAVGMESYAPSIRGGEAFNFEKQLEKFGAQAFLSQIPLMVGMGALSEAEGNKLGAAASALNVGMSEAEFLRELNSIEDSLKQARERIRTGNLIKPEQADKNSHQQPAQQQSINIGRFKVEIE